MENNIFVSNSQKNSENYCNSWRNDDYRERNKEIKQRIENNN